jgi:hypothetical protein
MSEIEPKGESKKEVDQALNEDDLKKVSGGGGGKLDDGFNPQPDPPG